MDFYFLLTKHLLMTVNSVAEVCDLTSLELFCWSFALVSRTSSSCALWVGVLTLCNANAQSEL